jgi:GntP family gluconate:H+ symporter
VTLLSTNTLAAASTAGTWTGHDTRLVVAGLLGIAVIVVLISQFKVHAFLALLLGSLVLGLVGGVPLTKLVDSFASGFGATAASVGALIALGSMLAQLLADSGGAEQIVDTILRRSGARALPWAMALIAALIGLPMFFEVGLVLLIPVILLVAQRSRQPLILVGIPALAGLSVLHGLVPPHPGPLVAISSLKADLGITLAFGLLVAIPTVIVAGPLFGRVAARWVPASPPEHLLADWHTPAETATGEDGQRRPSFPVTVLTVLLPVLLMLGKAVADIALGKSSAPRQFLDFVGAPLMALLIAVLVAMFTLGRPAGFDRGRLSSSIASSLPPIAGILLIVAAGGGFKQVLIDAGIGNVIVGLAQGAHFSPLVLGWLVAVAIRVATGSATVATVSASGIVAPLAVGLSPTHAALLVLAVGGGSLFFSHVNDAGFWMVKEYFGMRVGQTIKSWSIMETVISVVSLGCVLLLGLVV